MKKFGSLMKNFAFFLWSFTLFNSYVWSSPHSDPFSSKGFPSNPSHSALYCYETFEDEDEEEEDTGLDFSSPPLTKLVDTFYKFSPVQIGNPLLSSCLPTDPVLETLCLLHDTEFYSPDNYGNTVHSSENLFCTPALEIQEDKEQAGLLHNLYPEPFNTYGSMIKTSNAEESTDQLQSLSFYYDLDKEEKGGKDG